MKHLAVILLLFITCGLAPAQTQECVSLTHQALELSGFTQTIDQMTQVMSSEQFLQQMGAGREGSEAFMEVFKPLLQKDFNAEVLRKELESSVAAGCNPEQMSQAVQKMQTPFVARMLALEAATTTPEGQAKLKRYVNIAQTAPATDERLVALDALDASAGASNFATDSSLAVLRGMLTGVAAPPEVIAQIQEHRNEIKAQMQNTMELSFLVTYHGVTRPELQQYAGELNSQPLKGFYDQVKKAFLVIMEEHSRALGQDLKKSMPERRN
jgi:hypothetical protein